LVAFLDGTRVGEIQPVKRDVGVLAYVIFVMEPDRAVGASYRPECCQSSPLKDHVMSEVFAI
jgi:hypothetical protein